MTAILDIEVFAAAGWALLHFLWQGTALSVIAALLLRVSATQRASFRYLLAIGLLALAPIFLIGTIADQLRDVSVADALTQTVSMPDAVSSSGVRPVESTLPQTVTSVRNSDRAIAMLALLWLTAVLALTARLARSWRSAERIARALASHPIPRAACELVEAAFTTARARMHVARPVRLACVQGGNTPAVVGWLRVVILVPASLITGLTAYQIELLIAHELAHVRRHDFFVNLVQSWVETLFFFHPGIWWLSRRIRLERELACDDDVVAAYDRSAEYGEALARLALLDGSTPTLAVAATGSSLTLRIRRLFERSGQRDLTSNRWPLALAVPGALLVMLAGGQLASAQSAMRRMFEDTSHATGSAVISRHEHKNRHWTRSAAIISAVGNGQLESELRLGQRLKAIRLVARVQPFEGKDSGIVSLRAVTYGWRGKRVTDLLPVRGDAAVDPRSDSLVLTFVRESGLNAYSRATGIAKRNGTHGLLEEIAAIGDPVVRSEYLRAGIASAGSAGERDQLVQKAFGIRNSPVEVARVLMTAMKAAQNPDELISLIDCVPRVEGEAERLELLIGAAQLAADKSPAFNEAIRRGALTLPGDDAREAVRQALLARS